MPIAAFRSPIRFSMGFAALSVVALLTSCGQQEVAKTNGGSCSDTAVDTTGPFTDGTFKAIYNNTIKTACVECHVPSGAATVQRGVQLDFSCKASAFASLTSKGVTGQSSKNICPSPVKIVVAGNPANSFLVGSLIKSYDTGNNFAGVPGCSPYRLHQNVADGGDQNLTPAEEASIVQWIQSGAPNN